MLFVKALSQPEGTQLKPNGQALDPTLEVCLLEHKVKLPHLD